MSGPVPANERERLAALHACGVLDTPPEAAFDDIARLAGQLCATPIALVSLVDEHRQWFKARVGLPVTEAPRAVSFCQHTVAAQAPLEVADTLRDARFAGSPLVLAEPHIRFYAGVPLMLDPGLAVGTLCVLDRVPRQLADHQREALAMLARQVTNELELRRRLRAAQDRLGDALMPRMASAAATLAGDSEARRDHTAPWHPALAATKLRAGSLLAGRYRLERVLGAGGMGVVVGGVDGETGRRVAVKFLLEHGQRDPEAVERFVREARALLRVDSEYVVRVLDVGDLPDGAPYIVMEQLEGEDLATRLAQRGPDPAPVVLQVFAQVCAAVGHAHARGIVHRDLKPANLFLTRGPDGAAAIKVLDFGIAKHSPQTGDTDRGALTRTHAMLGSVHYMSPEQMRNARDLDERSDIWSLGVVLYQLLTGALPFAGDTVAEVCTRVMMEPLTALQALRPELPAELGRVVERCLDRDPARRFASAEELARALAACGELLAG